MIHIDGSYGEGGGQILRYGIALSVYTKQPITITDIRAKRDNPGLRPQHFTAVSCIKKICNAQTQGLHIGSKKLMFIPGEIQPDTYYFDIGTAGSICLIFQTCILSLLQTPKPITIHMIGGTDVPWAPTWDYFTNIFLSLLKKMGILITATLTKRGYYPKGAGKATITIQPLQSIKQITFDTTALYETIHATITTSKLPAHIQKRIKHTLIQQSIQQNLQCHIKTNTSDAESPGVVTTLWTSSPNILGTTILGKKAVPSEQIAKQAFQNIFNDIKNNTTIDSYAIDQLLPYIALAHESTTATLSHLTNHTKTTMWLLQQFFNQNISFKYTHNSISFKPLIHNDEKH